MENTHFKSLEKAYESYIPNNSLVVIRLDGNNFSSFTRDFVKPYDKNFAGTMDKVAEHLVNTISGSRLAYVQSDEISVVFSDLANEKTQMWFGGRVSKMLSLASSHATAAYMRNSDTEKLPIFDARVFVLQDKAELKDYVLWRRRDARKNAVTMAANTLYSHKFLMGKTTEERLELLKGTDLEVLPEEFFNGRLLFKKNVEENVTYVDRRTDLLVETMVTRARWETHPATDKILDKSKSFK